MSVTVRRAAALGLAASLLFGLPATAGAHQSSPSPTTPDGHASSPDGPGAAGDDEPDGGTDTTTDRTIPGDDGTTDDATTDDGSTDGTSGDGTDDTRSDDGTTDGGSGGAFTPTYAPGECPVPLPAEVAATVACGYVTVPLEHDEPAGETIELAVATFPATAPADEAPLVMLAGGPGELLVTPVLEGLASGLGGMNPQLHESRDFVLVDQRGVGASRPSLACPEVFEALTGATDSDAVRDMVPAAYASCRERLIGEGIELSAFDTENDVDDIDMVREALGYAQVHLFGTSYGARLAHQVAGEHPEGLASLVLSSPVPAEENFIADAGTSYDRVLRELDAACAADTGCAAFAPDLLDTFEATVAALEEQPAQVPFTDPATGQTVTIAVDGATLSQVVYGLFYAAGGPAIVPAVVAAAAEGDFGLLLVGGAVPTSAPIAYGLQASFICAEEAVESPPSEQVTPETLPAQLLVATNPVIGAGLEEVCAAWDVEPADAETFEPVSHDVPTLVVTGQFDQITPPSYGEAVAAALPNATYVEILGVGHSPLLNVGQCGAALLLAFVAAPTSQLDTSCLPTAPSFLAPDQVGGQAGQMPVEPPSPALT
ncbi:MAG: alpha/beta fold hydrolase [Acidimicrobiia bacterium]|nr:alpha/beta fold hydrolase [Acidimicrobiia bacterium]